MARVRACLAALSRVNDWLAIKITNAVGTMQCAYLFGGIALISLPDAIRAGRAAVVSWLAQTFLQLVLLSIIIVGQKVAGRVSELRVLAAEDRARIDHLALMALVQRLHIDLKTTIEEIAP